MKVFVLLMCAVASTTASSAVAWPGAVPLSANVKSIIPPQISGFGYSTSQYINAVPPPIVQPQFGYQIAYNPYFNPYQPIVGASYLPSNSFLYPSFSPIAPAAPGLPAQPPLSNPNRPSEQPAGDEDTSVIESADFPSGQQPLGNLPQSQPPQNSLDSKNMPAFPQVPQFPSQIPPLPQLPSLPQIPLPGSDIPNFPQFPQSPSSPFFPQSPSLPPSAIPADSDQGLNDEDTVSVDAV